MISIHEFVSPLLQRTVTVRVFVPEGEGPFPVVYMHDGHNLFDPSTSSFGKIWQVEDAMVYDIAPMIVVGIDAPTDNRRLDELSPFANKYSKGLGLKYLQVVLDIKTMIDATYPTKPEREFTAMMGSSMGGVISTTAMVHHGDLFGLFAFVSSAYWIDERLFTMVEQAQFPPCKIYMDLGTHEVGLKDPDDYMKANRQMRDLLVDKGLVVNYHEFHQAIHDEHEWAVRLPLILRYLFGGRK